MDDSSKSNRPGADERGLTLIELLFVAVLLALMSLVLYSSLNGVMRAKTMIDSETLRDRNAQYVLSRMTRELMTRMAIPLNSSKGTQKDSQLQIGSASSSPSSNLYLKGKSGKDEGGESDSLRFVSNGAAQEFFGAFANYGPVELEYRLEDQPENQRLGVKTERRRRERRDEEAGRSVLVREEYPANVSREEIIEERRVVFPLIEHVEALRFRYLKDGKWQDKWETARVLPDGVELSFTVREPWSKRRTYKAFVALGRASR